METDAPPEISILISRIRSGADAQPNAIHQQRLNVKIWALPTAKKSRTLVLLKASVAASSASYHK